MKVLFSYGKNNNKKKPTQSINIRVYHGRPFDVRRSLFLDISLKEWDFKNNHIVNLQNGVRTPEESKYLQEVQNRLNEIELKFNTKFLELKRNNQLKSLTTTDFNIWCDRILNNSDKPKQTRFLLTDKMTEYKDWKVLQGMKPSSAKSWTSRIKKLGEFEKDKKRKFYTDEIDLEWWGLLLKWVTDNGNSEAYHGDFIKKAKATLTHFKTLDPTFPFNVQFENKGFKVARPLKDKIALTSDEWEKIYTYSGTDKLNNTRDLAIIQYHACLRFSELKNEFEYYQQHGDFKNIKQKEGKYFWTIKEMKNSNKEKVKYKTVPVHGNIIEMYKAGTLPNLISNTNYNLYLKELFKELGHNQTEKIGSHTVRRSFISIHYNKDFSIKNIMQFSGHKTEGAFRQYIIEESMDIDNNKIPLERV